MPATVEPPVAPNSNPELQNNAPNDGNPVVAPSSAPDLLAAARRVKDPTSKLLGLEERPEKPEEQPKTESKTKETTSGEKPTDKSAEEKPKGIKAKAKEKLPSSPAPSIPQISEERIVELASKAATAINDSKPKAEQSSTAPELSQSAKEELAKYQKLEELFPNKYPKGSAQKQIEFEQKAANYERAWRKKNPGETFNPEDDAHNEFYSEQPELDDDDLKAAEQALWKDQAKREAMAELDPKLKRLEQEQIRIKAEPSAVQAKETVAEILFKQFNPDAKDVTESGLKAWADEHKLEAEALGSVLVPAQDVAYAASMLWDNAQQFDANNAAHNTAKDFANKFEAELKAADPDDLTDAQGRKWVPYAEFVALPKAQQLRFRTTEKQHLLNYIAVSAADFAKKQAEELRANAEKMAEMLGYVKPSVSEPTQKPNNGAASDSSVSPVPPAKSTPSSSLSGASPTPPQRGVVETKSESGDSVLNRLLGL